MKLLLFQFKLLVFLALFLLNLVFIQIKKAKLLFLAIFIVLFLINLMFFYIIKEKINNEETQNNSSYFPSHPDQYLKSEKTESEIRTEILYWENIIEKQPSSRDALINLSILKKILLEDEEAEDLWNQAKNLDPNNPILKN
ncbi:MAG: hypothetical protein COZ34_00420 [Candidatus Pacebacteria bacterium CG_4_10_14_3_um_filter_34_15]|nr:hypothetical protein [Candidatus Pacearchaeota archaeon]NCQ65652.1 hypothetical protein [Candidatus Paceibacterota bacterium]OIO43705.1 MAG: hypothetical protein AUJ41_04485 [Candidatus Pacebacteria bacterium CG1_02_43_31]PIQ80679.1 MAG: hypothetical protein COV78_04300 [Candidatus Pacebacteria bacterium CG11_big_fil_rev_8_21_14_0_20_34_55]PIX81991.1 MAG: hypothetical protein COZ34_00420 [Candidatus Pacebacteria bacterium CG_4_10_14_3_um_filter_34_15]PJC43585.1 MAG: hypothetical protein CO0